MQSSISVHICLLGDGALTRNMPHGCLCSSGNHAGGPEKSFCIPFPGITKPFSAARASGNWTFSPHVPGRIKSRGAMPPGRCSVSCPVTLSAADNVRLGGCMPGLRCLRGECEPLQLFSKLHACRRDTTRQ
jgi:hypothetical protein